LLYRLHTATANWPAAMAEARWLATKPAEGATYAEELVAGVRTKVDATWSNNDRMRLNLPRTFDTAAPALDRQALTSYPRIDSHITSIKNITGNTTHKQVSVAPTKETMTTIYRREVSHGPDQAQPRTCIPRCWC